MNPLGLATIFGLLGQSPSTDPQSPLKASTASPAGTAPAPQGPELSPAMALMLGQQMGEGGGGNALVTTLFRQLEQQQIQQQQARQLAAALAPVQGLVREGRYGEAATAYRTASQFAPTPGHAEAFNKAADKYEEMAGKVLATEAASQGPALFAAAEAQKPGSGPQAILGNQDLVRRLANYPGGPLGLVEALKTTYSNGPGGVQMAQPSPLIGGAPQIIGAIPEPPKMDEKTQKLMASHGWDTETIRQAYVTGNQPMIQVIQGQLQNATQQVRAEEVVDRLKMPADIIQAIPMVGTKLGVALKPYEVLKGFEGGDPAAVQIVQQAQKLVDRRAIDKAVTEARERLLNERAIEGDDTFRVGGYEAFDQVTGRPKHVTLAMSQNPSLFAANGGRITYMSSQEAQAKRFLESEIDPSLDALQTLGQRILAKAKVANIPTGAKLDAMKWAGDADVRQFNEERRKLQVALGRIEGGSVRIPVTMLKMLDDTTPTTYSTVEQMMRLTNATKASSVNRVKSWLNRNDFIEIPTDLGEWTNAGPNARFTEGVRLPDGTFVKKPGAKK